MACRPLVLLTVLAVSGGLASGCGGPTVQRIDADVTRFLDGGTPEPPGVPRVEMAPSAVPFPLVTLRGTAANAKRVLIRGSENPLASDLFTDGTFCVDVPLRETRVFALEVLSQSQTGEFSAPVMLSVEFNPAAPDIPNAQTCAGADPRGCVRANEVCSNSRDDDCDGLVDDRDPDCATCPDDLLENNDVTPAPRIGDGRHDNLRICPGDGDYYAYPMSTGNRIDARVLFAHANGDLDLSLIDPAGMIVAMASTQDDDEMFSHTATMDGLYHVYVFGVTGDVETNYSLDVQITE